MLADGPREWSYSNDAVVDLDDLRNSSHVSLADDEPRALTDEFGVKGFVHEGPGQTGFVFAVEVDDKVQFGQIGVGIHGVTHRSRDS
jgi:hypothetical protein